jgi:hypothetical protein
MVHACCLSKASFLPRLSTEVSQEQALSNSCGVGPSVAAKVTIDAPTVPASRDQAWIQAQGGHCHTSIGKMLGWRAATDFFGPSLGALYLSRALYISVTKDAHGRTHCACFHSHATVVLVVHFNGQTIQRSWQSGIAVRQKRLVPTDTNQVSNWRGLAGRRAGDSVSVAIRIGYFGIGEMVLQIMASCVVDVIDLPRPVVD